ncbi:hypothetical protein [Bradyrhizobium sp. SZCCHNR2028]|uniref:hypothetical protein n=1 Tax=Bradyrhizobium sp. SZCCHNR2028 TaxID=3057382 RepID=UPI0028EDA021|nr:hypothetical protein [Bradyrhizobium sp. SZCCHNR2028]
MTIEVSASSISRMSRFIEASSSASLKVPIMRAAVGRRDADRVGHGNGAYRSSHALRKISE